MLREKRPTSQISEPCTIFESFKFQSKQDVTNINESLREFYLKIYIKAGR